MKISDELWEAACNLPSCRRVGCCEVLKNKRGREYLKLLFNGDHKDGHRRIFYWMEYWSDWGKTFKNQCDRYMALLFAREVALQEGK
jgi:hypothetical protein